MRYRRAIIPILVMLVVFMYGIAAAERYPAELFYFYPDSPQSNLSRLKRNMDDLLFSAGLPISFQPFTHLVDLENQLNKRPPAFIFIPQWYFEKYGAALHLRPFLVPVRKGNASYRKILVALKNSSLTRIQMSHTTMAMTSMGPDGDTALDSILFPHHGVKAHDINAIIVPKDADALFALALGQVDMALVVKENMDLIAKINPNILQSIHPLLESKPIPMPLLCYTEGVAAPSTVRELKNLFLDGRAREGYTIIMEMLQINGWQAVQP
jgi:hypothetical protein